MSNRLLAHEDNVEAQLNAGISAITTTIPLQTGDGALLPTTYSGAATSLGSSTLLNDTGIGASGISVGDIIENVTDGSYAVVLAVSADSVTTTRLKGGSDNTWQNSDAWAVNRFVITVIQYDTDGTTILKREKVLIDSRSGDNLTVNASGRGYDGSTALSFDSGDYVYLFTTSVSFDGLSTVISDIIEQIDGLVSQTGSEIYAADSVGTDSYAVTLSPAPTSLTTGQEVRFRAGTANTGAATLDVNSLGAATIKKAHDQDLDSGDIESGQIVTVVYDGTYWQMQSQPGSTYATKNNVQDGSILYAADAGSNDTYAITLSPAPTALTTGMTVYFKANTVNTGAATLNVNGLGAVTIKKNKDQDLSDGDIKAGQIVIVSYDGTYWQMQSQSGITPYGVTSITAGETITAGEVLRIHTDGYAYRAYANASAGFNAIVGIALSSAAIGASVLIALPGNEATASGLTIASRYYLQDYTGPGTTITQATESANWNVPSGEYAIQTFTPTSSRIGAVTLRVGHTSGDTRLVYCQLYGSDDVQIGSTQSVSVGTGSFIDRTFTFNAAVKKGDSGTYLKVYAESGITLTIYGVASNAYANGALTSTDGTSITGDADAKMTITEYSNFGAIGTSAGTTKVMLGVAKTAAILLHRIQVVDTAL